MWQNGSNWRAPRLATKAPAVIRAMEDMRKAEGIAFFKMTTLRTRLTRGVQRLMAPYMGMFMPCRAIKEREEWVAKQPLHGRKSRLSFKLRLGTWGYPDGMISCVQG